MAITHEVANALVAEIATLAGNVAGKVSSARRSSHTGVVDHVDRDGVAWVLLPGSTVAVPASVRDVEVRPGQQVTVTFEGHALLITGNQGDPAMGESGVEAAIKPRLARIGKETSKAKQAADAAAKVAKAIRQHFWHDGAGAHISSKAGDAEGAQNALWNSLGMLFRKGVFNVLAVVTGSDPGVDVYDGQGNAGSNIIAAFHGSGARIGPEDGTHVSIDSDSMDVMGDDEAVLATFGADETHLGLAGKGAVFLAGDSFELMADSYSSYPPEIDWDDMHALQLGSCRIIPLDEEDDDPMSTVDETYFEVLDRGNVVKIVSRRREWYGKEPTEPPWTRGDLPFDRWIAPDTSHVAKVELGTDSNGSSLSLSADVLWANDALVGDPSTDERYGYASRSTSLSISNNTGTAVCYHDFAPGTYLVYGHCYFASNATGRREAELTTASGTTHNNAAAMHACVQAASGGATHITVAGIFSPSASQRLYLNALQASGGALNVQGQMRWVKLL